MKIVWVIGGVDPTGAAGLAADLRTLAAMGVHGASIVTALTVQTSARVEAVEAVEGDLVARQIAAAGEVAPPDAIKIGLIPDPSVVAAVAEALIPWPGVPRILDPVLAASAGRSLVAEGTVSAWVAKLFPGAALVTPNVPEAGAFLGRTILPDPASFAAAARDLLALGPRAVLLKGGHRPGDADDLFLESGADPVELAAERIDSPHTRGTGCVLASAIAALVARGRPLGRAVSESKEFTRVAIEQGLAIGTRGPVHVLHEFYGSEGLP